MYFTNPKALVVAEDGTQMTITSDKGIVDRQKRTIEIKPPVKAETDKGDTLQTDGSVYYNMDTRMIKGGKVVMDRHDKTSLKADAFETDSSLTKVTLTGHAQVTKGE
jgi:lipopolysaccharide export system protein LptC